jgi:hypothetical protein
MREKLFSILMCAAVLCRLAQARPVRSAIKRACHFHSSVWPIVAKQSNRPTLIVLSLLRSRTFHPDLTAIVAYSKR